MAKRLFTPSVTAGLVPALFRGWKEWEEGDFIEGQYHSHYMSDYNGQPQYNWRIKVLRSNFLVTLKDGSEKSPIGELLVLNSAGTVNKCILEAMEAIDKTKIGVYIEYAGKKRGSDPKNKQEYHTFNACEAGELDLSDDDSSEGL